MSEWNYLNLNNLGDILVKEYEWESQYWDSL